MAQVSWDESYLGKLRAAVGNDKLITVACRGIIFDTHGRVLLVRRVDNGAWVMPAGAIELNESVFDALKREVWEETGLIVESAELITVNSNPEKYSYSSWGFDYQMLSFVFLVTGWSGELQTETTETVDAAFFHLDDLPIPHVPQLYIETLEDLQCYKRTGRVTVK